jgi:protein-disulfide isomerase
LAIMVGLTGPAGSGAGTEEELAIIQRDLAEVKRDVAEIKAILLRITPRARAEPASAEVRVTGRPGLGRPDAPVTIVEFSDYQCPFCKRFFDQTLPEVKKRYIDTGKVRYVFRDMPLPIHPQAPKAAEAAHCAGEQDRYWAMHDALFRNQGDLSVHALKRYATGLALDSEKFTECLDSGRWAGEVEKEQQAASEAGVRGTPSFVIGPSTSGDTISGRLLVGAQPFAAFQVLIESQLEAADKTGRK